MLLTSPTDPLKVYWNMSACPAQYRERFPRKIIESVYAINEENGPGLLLAGETQARARFGPQYAMPRTVIIDWGDGEMHELLDPESPWKMNLGIALQKQDMGRCVGGAIALNNHPYAYGSSLDREIRMGATIEHELRHIKGIGHQAPNVYSIMNAHNSGIRNVHRSLPTAIDRKDMAELYGHDHIDMFARITDHTIRSMYSEKPWIAISIPYLEFNGQQFAITLDYIDLDKEGRAIYSVFLRELNIDLRGFKLRNEPSWEEYEGRYLVTLPRILYKNYVTEGTVEFYEVDGGFEGILDITADVQTVTQQVAGGYFH
ncbi:MAG: hypothetical protein DHS20C12_11620 [Pseudohongiella sp.]|nr:MAG: hypothetical protein DHS20C12_11620 [Pseudohongiella sp.]